MVGFARSGGLWPPPQSIDIIPQNLLLLRVFSHGSHSSCCVYSPTDFTDLHRTSCCVYSPTDFTEFTELLAEIVLPQISQIYTEVLAEIVLPQISQNSQNSQNFLLRLFSHRFHRFAQNFLLSVFSHRFHRIHRTSCRDCSPTDFTDLHRLFGCLQGGALVSSAPTEQC